MQPYRQQNSTELLKRAQSGDSQARSELITINTPLVKAMVHRFSVPAGEREDLMQIGFVGLLKAINGFNDKYGVAFSTYAVPLIIGELKRYMRDVGAVRVTRSIKELALRIRKAERELMGIYGREPTVDELAQHLNCTRDSIVEALESTRKTVSLEQPLPGEDGETLLNRLCAPQGCDRIDIILLKDSVRTLPVQERNLIIMRYYLNYTQTKIANELGMSQVQVSRLESRIIKKLAEKMSV